MALADLLRATQGRSVSPTPTPIGQPAIPEQRLANVFDDATTRGQISFVGNQADEFAGFRPRARAAIDNSVNRTRRAAGATGSAGAAATLGDQVTGARDPNDVVTNALRRAKARVGIINRGDAAARNQQLTDRLRQVRSGIAGQGRALQLQTAGQNIRSGVLVNADASKARGDAAVAGAVGGSLGGLAATLKNNKSKGTGLFDFNIGGHT